MAEEDPQLVRQGDHVVFTGTVDEDTGGHDAVVYHEDGTTDNVVSLQEKGRGQECHTERCGEFPGMSNVHHVVSVGGTGHRGPAIVNCQKFRDGFDRTWGSRKGADGEGQAILRDERD